MVGVLVQLLTLLSGVMVNFITPLIYGVEQYGLFIKTNILVYVFHRFSDITSESLIAMCDRGNVFVQSTIVNVFYFILFSVLSCLYDIGNVLLMAGMLLSSSVLLSFYARMRVDAVLVFLFFVTLSFFVMSGLQWFGFVNIEIWQMMVLSSLPAASVGFAILVWLNRDDVGKISSYTSLWKVVIGLPKMITMTLVFNCLTNFIPYIATHVLTPREIGSLRIMLSVVQSVSSVFPLNVKQLFAILVGSEKKHGLLLSLIDVSIAYFLSLVCGVLLLVLFIPSVQPYTHLLALLPLFFCSMLVERYLQSSGEVRLLVWVNFVLAALIMFSAAYFRTLPGLMVLYAIGISVYFSILLIVSGVRLSWRYALLVLSGLVQSAFIGSSVPAAFGISICTLALFIFRHGTLRADFSTIRREVG